MKNKNAFIFVFFILPIITLALLCPDDDKAQSPAPIIIPAPVIQPTPVPHPVYTPQIITLDDNQHTAFLEALLTTAAQNGMTIQTPAGAVFNGLSDFKMPNGKWQVVIRYIPTPTLTPTPTPAQVKKPKK